MTHRSIPSLLAALAVTGSLLAPAHAQTVKICPLGDSITESDNGRASYRYYLDQLLTGGGYSFDFVGHNYGVFSGTPLYANFDQNHESYSGWQVNHILLDLQWWTQETVPDVFIIHLGTNDLLAFQSDASTIAELTTCIDVIRGVNPYATVLVSQIIPMVFRNVTGLNGLMPAMVSSLDTPHSRVVLVDQYTGFDLGLHLLPDGLHPNDAGEQRMASIYYTALQSLLAPPPSAPSFPSTGCAGSANIPGSLSPVVGQAPVIGQTYTLRVDNAPPSALAFGFLDVDATQFQGVPLPIDLTPLGAPGCNLYVGPTLTQPLVPGAGFLAWSVPVPNDPLISGTLVYQQVAFVDPSLNALGLTTTNATVTAILPAP